MGKAMVRRQVHLTAELDERLRLEAARQRRPEAEILREALAARLDVAGTDSVDRSGDPLWNMVGIGASKAGDLSERLDEALYGKSTARR